MITDFDHRAARRLLGVATALPTWLQNDER